MKKYLPDIFRFAISLFLLWSGQAKAQGTETFESQTVLTSSYTSGSFMSEAPGTTVNFVQSRNSGAGTSANYSISGKGIILRRASALGSVEFVIPNGVGTFKFNYRKAFTGAEARALALFVDGTEAGVTPTFGAGSGDQTQVYEFSVVIDKPGAATVKISYPAGTGTIAGSDRLITIDNVTWTGFSGTAQPNISIEGNGIAIPTGDNTPAAADGTDFGSAIGGAVVSRTFTIRNAGSAPLVLNNPPVTLASGTAGFSVSAQPGATVIDAFKKQDFTMMFSSTVPGVHTETVSIGSNDGDTPMYTFTVTASVLQPQITTNKNLLSGFTYPFSQGPSLLQNFTVNANNLMENVTVTASPNWEISTNQTYSGSNSTPWTTIVLDRNASGGITNKVIHVRLKDGLPIGVYVGTVTLSSLSAVSQTIALSGAVTAGVAEIKVTGNGSSVNNGSISPSGLNNTLFASQNLGQSQTKSFEIKNLGGAPLTIGGITVSGDGAAAFTLVGAPPENTVLAQNETVSFDVRFAPTTVGIKSASVSITNSDADDNPYMFAIRGGAEYCSSRGEIIVAQQDFEALPSVQEYGYSTEPVGQMPPGVSTGFSTGQSGNSDAPKGNKLYSHGARGYRVQGRDTEGKTASGIRFTFNSIDTSVYTDLSFSFKLAGFSLGSGADGMDRKNDESDAAPAAEEDKIDHVLVEISPDGGVTWYAQAKIVSDGDNVAWSFGSKGTTSGSRGYMPNSNLSYFKSVSDGAKYSALSITGLPQVSALRIRITAQNNSVNESWIIDDVRVTSSGLVPKVWNGNSWSPSAPQASDKAIITGDYNLSANGSFTACQCEVSSGATLIVPEGGVLKISDILVNNGNIIVESDGNLIQYNEIDGNSGTGFFRAERKIKLSAARQQYNYLISPAVDWNMKDIYKDSAGNPVPVPFVLYHNEATNTFANSSGAYIRGRALAVKEPAAAFVLPEITAGFEGKPSNGTFNYSMVNSNPANPKRGFNLIGNPYPSNIDLVKFYQNNSASNQLSPTFYFWDSTANTQTVQMGDGYTGEAYAFFNAATPPGEGTGTKAAGDTGAAGIKLPTRYVKVAQGFMAKLIGNTQLDISFNNDIRVADSGEGFFGKGEEIQPDRFWLNMANPAGIASNIAIVYFPEGDDAYTMHDSESMGGSDVIYSLVDGEKVSINGKSGFVPEDVVMLGSSHFSSGMYTISVERAQGVFARDQAIFLKDKLLGVITKISEGPYTFFSDAGETAGRFDIVYKPSTALATEGEASGVTLYRNGYLYTVKSTQKILHLAVYDSAGRVVYMAAPNSSEFSVDMSRYSRGVYIFKIQRPDRVFTRKVRN